MTMTVGELKELLEDYEDSTPIMIAHQPNWPLAEKLSGVKHTSEKDDEHDGECPLHPDFMIGHADCDYEPEAGEDGDDEHDPCLWLVAGGHEWDRSPYAPKWVFESEGL